VSEHHARKEYLSSHPEVLAQVPDTSGRPNGRHTAELAAWMIDTDPEMLHENADETQRAVIGDAVTPVEINTQDMPDTVLSGRLGEICQRQLNDFPIAFSWTAIITAASVLVPAPTLPFLRSNVYSALLGPSQCGKSACYMHAFHVLGIAEPLLLKVSSGSPEMLAELLEVDGAARLYFPDELAHLLIKASIEGSSFGPVLNSCYFETTRTIQARGGEKAINCRLSIAGGLVSERWDDYFGTATIGGLYERFIFGLAPSGFVYDYLPPCHSVKLTPVPVYVHDDVFEARKAFRQSSGIPGHVLERALRVAYIVASMDGKEVLRGADLEPCWRFAEYQHSIRQAFAPNPGKNNDAVLGHKIIRYLDRCPGQWVNRRTMLRTIHGYDHGPSTVERAIRALV
jgi:hypothetical protein